MKDNIRKLKRVSDLMLIAALLVVALALLLWQRAERTGGAEAAVYVNGECTARYPLGEDRTVELRTADGASYNILVIEDGAARIREAGCPDKICVKTGAVRYSGESITCLPNRTMIVIEGGEKQGVDIG